MIIRGGGNFLFLEIRGKETRMGRLWIRFGVEGLEVDRVNIWVFRFISEFRVRVEYWEWIGFG